MELGEGIIADDMVELNQDEDEDEDEDDYIRIYVCIYGGYGCYLKMSTGRRCVEVYKIGTQSCAF